MKKNRTVPIAILVNDIHLTKDNGSLVKGIIGQICDYGKKNDVKTIIFGGDIFTNRSGQPLQCLIDFKIILEDYLDGFEIHIIPGNHDKTDPDSNESYLDIYSSFDNVMIHREACVRGISKCDFLFIPYYSTKKWNEEFSRVIKNVKFEERVCFCVTHIAVNGVMNNDGSIVDGDVDGEKLKDFDSVFVGHYHNASDVGSNIHYTGSAYQSNYGEDMEKGFTVIYSDGSFERVKTDFPRYIKHTIKATDKETLVNLLEKYDHPEKDFVRFEFVGKRTDLEKIDTNHIQNEYGIECKFVSDEEKQAIEMSVEESVMKYSCSEIKKDFMKFCAEYGIRGAELSFGLKLIKKI